MNLKNSEYKIEPRFEGNNTYFLYRKFKTFFLKRIDWCLIGRFHSLDKAEAAISFEIKGTRYYDCNGNLITP